MARPMFCLDDAPSDHVVHSLRDQIDLLEEMVRQYREASENVPTYPITWGLTRKEAGILARLERARGETVSKENLLVTLYGLEVSVEAKIIDVFVCKLRRKVSGAGIQIRNNFGLGYRLTSESVLMLRSLLAVRDAAQEREAGSEIAALTARISELEAENARLLASIANPVAVPIAPAEIASPPQRIRSRWRDHVKSKPKHRAGAAPGRSWGQR